MEAASSSTIVEKHMQEFPFSPSEAFLTVSNNDFPVIELREQLELIKKHNLHLKMGHTGTLYKDDEGNVKFKMDLEGKLQPLWTHKVTDADIHQAIYGIVKARVYVKSYYLGILFNIFFN